MYITIKMYVTITEILEMMKTYHLLRKSEQVWKIFVQHSHAFQCDGWGATCVFNTLVGLY